MTVGADPFVTHGADNRATLLTAVRCEHPNGNAADLLGQWGIGRFIGLGSIQCQRTHC